MKIISAILILVIVFLNVKHGWAGITNNIAPEQAKMMDEMGVSKTALFVFSIFTLAGAAMILFPVTFFAGNLLNAAMILLIMAQLLRAGNLKMTLIEIPFLLMPLVLIYLGHPLKK